MKKHSIAKDNRKRILFKKYELKKNLFKSILLDKNIALTQKELIQKKYNQIPRDSSLTRIRNRCILTGRGRGVYSFFKLSRLSFRELALSGFLPGIRKASW